MLHLRTATWLAFATRGRHRSLKGESAKLQVLKLQALTRGDASARGNDFCAVVRQAAERDFHCAANRPVGSDRAGPPRRQNARAPDGDPCHVALSTPATDRRGGGDLVSSACQRDW